MRTRGAGRGDGGEVELVDGLPGLVRAGREDLHGEGAVVGQVGEVRGARRGLAGGVAPVLEEDELEPAHGGAFEGEVGVAVGAGAAGGDALVVGDVDPAGEALVAVDDHDLAVGAEVEEAGAEPGQGHRAEPGEAGAGLAQGGEEAAVEVVGPHAVAEQAHLDAGAGALDEEIADLRVPTVSGSKM